MEQLTKNLKNIAIIILVIALLFSVNTCVRTENLAKNQLSAMNDTITYYTNALGTETASKEVLRLERDQFKEHYLDAKTKALTKPFAEVKTVIKTKTEIRIDSVFVPFTREIPCDFEPIVDIYKDKSYYFGYNVKKNGLTVTDFTLTPDEQTIIIGNKRKWFLGKNTYTADITHSNELMKTADTQVIEIVVKKPFYDTRLFNFAVGVGAGLLLAK